MTFEEQADDLRRAITARDLKLAELTRDIAQLRSSVAPSTGPALSPQLLNDYIAESREATKEMNLAVERLEAAMRRLDGRA